METGQFDSNVLICLTAQNREREKEDSAFVFTQARILKAKYIESLLQSGEEMSSSIHCLDLTLWQATKQALSRVRAQSPSTAMPSSPARPLCCSYSRLPDGRLWWSSLTVSITLWLPLHLLQSPRQSWTCSSGWRRECRRSVLLASRTLSQWTQCPDLCACAMTRSLADCSNR